MGRLVDYLKEQGCVDMDKTLHRFCGNEAFYEKCFMQFLTDPGFDALCRQLEEHDIQAAFESAHTLKGVAANLGLTPMHALLIQIVEPLRVGTEDGVMEACDRLFALRDTFRREFLT